MFSGWRPSLRLRAADLRPHLSFGLYQTGQRLVNVLVQHLDKILIGRLLGTTELGYYTVAYQLMVRPMMLINPVVTRVAFPVFARMLGDVRRVREGYLEMLRLLAFVMMPLYLAMFAVSGPLIRVLLGEAWMPVEPVFRILVLLGLVQSMGNPLDSLLLALGKARLAFWFNVLALCLYAAAIPIGTRYGLQGVAYGLLIACVGALVPADIWLRWTAARMTPGEYARAWMPFLAMGAAMAAPLAWAAPRLSQWHPAAALAALAVCGAAAYLAMAALWKRAFLERVIRMTAGGA
jgi:lipopolysaccharide exporter